MKIFDFNHDQLVAIIGDLIADELSRRFGRYTDTTTLAKWNGATKVGRGGVELSTEQQRACGARVAGFFGHDDDALMVTAGDTIEVWATRLVGLVSSELSAFRFHPSSHKVDAETRHNADDIWQDAASVASLLQGRRRVVSLVSAQSVMGLVASVLAPNLLRLDVVDARGKSPDEISGLLSFGDLIIATPTLWRYLADTIPAVPSNVMGLTFGERMAVDLSGRLRQRGIGAMRELYGSTETGVLGWRDSPPDSFVLFDHFRRDDLSIRRIRTNGRPAPLLPMDDLEWDGERSFAIGTRRDGAVQIGAINVFPQSIGQVILEHPAVVGCEVRVSRRSGALDRLISDIRLHPDRIADQAMAWSIDEWCRERLRPAERPRIYSFLPPAAD